MKNPIITLVSLFAIAAIPVCNGQNRGQGGDSTPTPPPTASPTPTASSSSTPTPSASPTDGIAAGYPRDAGIGNDPAVILADNFDGYTAITQLGQKWDAVYHVANMKLVTTGALEGKSLEMTLPINPNEVANALTKNVSHDALFIRAYTKFDPSYSVQGSNHNGVGLATEMPGPGIKPAADGTCCYAFTLQNVPKTGEAPPGRTHFYSYWPRQITNYGDHWYPDGIVNSLPGFWLTEPGKYPDFRKLPNFTPQRDRWYCYELMVQANTPGQSNGQVSAWIDGKLVADFPNLNLRSLATLKLTRARIQLHAQHSERVNKKFYDNVVIATKYIGPMTP